jgi:hypothetical protein
LIKIPQIASWSQRKILKLRGIAKFLMIFMIGNGSRIFLWLNSWHPDGVLFDIYGYRIIYDSRRKCRSGGDWNWAPARFEDLVGTQCQLSDVQIGSLDAPIWLPIKTHKFSSKDTWDAIRVKLPKVDWDKLIWFSMAILENSFFLMVGY